jgi:hypothetical protein
MAISTIEGVIAGVKPPIYVWKNSAAQEAIGVNHSLFYSAGLPGAATAPTSALAGDALTSYAGQIPMPSFSNNTHLLKFSCMAGAAAGIFYLADRLWHNATIVSSTTTGQTINSTAWPARDANGSTNGDGVLVGIEVSTATTNGAAITNTTLTYTNSSNTGSRTATIPSTLPGGGFPATAVAGTFVPFVLQAGDVGVRSIQTLTLGTSYGTGVIHLVAYRVLAVARSPTAGMGMDMDMAATGFPRLYDNTTPFLFWTAGATALNQIHAQVVVAQG